MDATQPSKTLAAQRREKPALRVSSESRTSAALRALGQLSSSASLLASQAIARASKVTREVAADPSSLGLRIRANLAQRAVKRSVERHEERRIADEWSDFVQHAQSGLAPWQMHGMEAHAGDMTASSFQAPRSRAYAAHAVEAQPEVQPLPAGTGLRDRASLYRTSDSDPAPASLSMTVAAWQGFPSALVDGGPDAAEVRSARQLHPTYGSGNFAAAPRSVKRNLRP